MANERVVLEFSLQDVNNSIKGANKDAQALRGTLESIQRISTKSGSKAKAAAFGGVMGGNEYDVARGSAGATGASGRDFANQARGLDGLVRLYATYAANLFAAGAAFRALSNAADTSNMVKGMDQLGAASGQALGTVAKRLVDVTDGAISFRDAMEATTKGSAAGLSSQQMMQLGEVAKKASQALGISMTDAVSRLSRGISKLEPELLDELGLFTKIDMATQAYARSVGKTAASLTDFEKRQAFATAVLKEGLDKFSAIDISANPYDKLLASLQNLGQGALEIVNKVLTPLVSVLSQSPGALIAILTAIGASIVKSAIPALGKYRESLAATAEASRNIFSKIYADQQRSLGDLEGAAAVKAEASYRASSKVLNKTKELEKQATKFTAGKIDYATLAAKDPFAMTAQEIKSLDNRAKYLATRNAEEAALLKAHVKEIKRLRAEATAAGDIAQQKVTKSTSGVLTTPGANDVIYKRQIIAASTDAIRVSVAETQAIYGMRAAFGKLGEELTKSRAGMQTVQSGIDESGKAIVQTVPKIGLLRAGYIGLTQSVGIVGAKILKTAEAIGPWLMAAGLAVEVFGLLDSALSRVSRESETFTKALQYSQDAVDNVTRTIDALSKKDAIAPATISGIFALSNAMNELTSSTELSIYAAEKLKDAIAKSPYDKLRQAVLSVFGKDVDTELAKTLADSVQSSIKIFAKAGRGEEASAAFKEALGLESLDTDSLTKAFSKSTDAVQKFEAAQKKLNGSLGTTSSILQGFKTTTENSVKAYQEFIQSTANTNPLFKLGASLEDVGASMQKVLKGGITEINAAFDDLTKHPEKFTLFGSSFVQSFIGIREEFTKTFAAQQRYVSGVSELDTQMEELQNKLTEAEARRASGLTKVGGKNAQFIANAKQELQDLGNKKASLLAPNTQEVFAKVTKIFTEGATNAFTEGSKLIEQALGQASEKAALSIAKANLGALTGERAAVESGKLKQRELDIQLEAISTNIDLINSQAALKSSIDALTAASELVNSTSKDKSVLEAEKLAVDTFRTMLKELPKGAQMNFVSTGNELADNSLKLKINEQNKQIASQLASAKIIRGEKGAAKIETDRAVLEGRLKDEEKLKGLASEVFQQYSAQFSIIGSITNALSEQNLLDQISLENSILQNKQALELQGINNAITNAKKADKPEEVAFQTAILGLVTQRQKLEKDNKGMQDAIKQIDLRVSKEKLYRDIKAEADANSLKIDAAILGSSQELYNVQSSLGMIYGEQAENQRKYLESATLSNSIAQSELALQTARNDKLAEIQSRIDKAKLQSKDLTDLNAEKAATEASFAAQKTALDITNQGRQKALDLTQSFTDRQLAYGEVFKNSFQSMGDAIIEFTKTGKLNFKGMIDSMIEGLIRYEMQQQALSMYAAFRPGLMNLISSVFAKPTGMGASPDSIDVGNGLKVQAKGGAYDTGLQMFAKGGMFTNSIVNSPTLFKFARGTGLMGEAGPEAIMPLKRDSNGNLGVRAGSHTPSVDVVVNNFGSEKATTKETTDSRGNRKIEVVIGDMVAGEIGRTGSSIQQSLSGNFNTRPAVARR